MKCVGKLFNCNFSVYIFINVLKIIASRDEGEYWEELGFLNINDISSDLGYPCSVQLKDGSILTVFYAHAYKNSPAEILQVVWKIED